MIKLESIYKDIKGKNILSDINYNFKKGKIYLLKGPNGSGKTMLLRLLCDLIHPTSGNIDKPKYSYGVIIENSNFVENETARSNLKFLASIKKKINMKQIEYYLSKVNLIDYADVKVKKYSLGMKQRLAICQAIMEEPDVLLLDEPFNALDDKNFMEIVKYIESIKEDRIIIIAAHGFNLQELSLFDEIITMQNGQIVNIKWN
ncbi:ATP-binding cassette domain-containing protein [Senegalia massiliensis]|uniref:ABC transporter ATP-binding protein n=1 Tax=Senegalia massiliensis TaxID=1720316 RepID=A0A845QYP7_9CLOT|nr:ABC transporter ATP-binding protein [Senegalia massiliensis]NBI06909.1 ABC transporter ATP-binding protein [Senegalia massiliensis]